MNELTGLDDLEEELRAQQGLDPAAVPVTQPEPQPVNVDLLQGLTQIGAGLAGQKADTSGFDQARKLAMTDAESKRKAVSDYIRAKDAKRREDTGERRHQERMGLDREKIAAAIEGRSGKNRELEALPGELQTQITTLSSKTAGKKSIANQIEAATSDWDTLSDSQKLDRGRSLIKVLNSSEGADAVSADEAARLAGRLEFGMGNLRPDDPNFGRFQVGRDLGGFKEQALSTAKSLRNAVNLNDQEVNNIYRQGGVNRPTAPSKTTGGITAEQARAELARRRALKGK